MLLLLYVVTPSQGYTVTDYTCVTTTAHASSVLLSDQVSTQQNPVPASVAAVVATTPHLILLLVSPDMTTCPSPSVQVVAIVFVAASASETPNSFYVVPQRSLRRTLMAA